MYSLSKNDKDDKVDYNYMRTNSNDKFFNKSNMKFFKGSKYSTHYNEKSGKNFIIEKSPYGNYGYHRYDVQTGKTTPGDSKEVYN